MYIRTDDYGLILSYSTIGQIDGGQKYSGSVPEDFETTFKTEKYMLQNGEINLNSEYVEPTESTAIDVQPTAEQQAITALAQQVADLTETNTQLEQAITALTTGGDN